MFVEASEGYLRLPHFDSIELLPGENDSMDIVVQENGTTFRVRTYPPNQPDWGTGRGQQRS